MPDLTIETVFGLQLGFERNWQIHRKTLLILVYKIFVLQFLHWACGFVLFSCHFATPWLTRWFC